MQVNGQMGEEREDGEPGSRSLPAQFGQVLDTTDTVVWEARLDDLSVEYLGPAERVTGVSPDDAASLMKLNTRMVHPEDQATAAREFGALLEGEKASIDTEFRTNPENGPVRWLRAQASLEQQDGETRITGIATDITPLKRREARLEEFAGVVSHDLRNPLSVATGRVELAQQTDNSDHLTRARDALDRMDVLIENLLMLARTDRSIGDPEPVALGSVVHDAWGAVDTTAATLVVDTDRTVRADRARLQQLLENLVRNAVEHGLPDSPADNTGNGGDESGDGTDSELTVRVGTLPNGFAFEDDGVGFPEDRRETLFDGAARAGEHTGLGLRIVEQVVEAHNWVITATESDTGGARMEITGVEFA